MNLWLVGMMASGKTTVGKLTARNLGLAFIDTDEMVEDALGKTIANIWDDDGEAGFRRIEREMVLEAAGSGGVISTGGGVATSPKNRATMLATGRVVWLQASPATIVDRLRGQAVRPLIEGSTLSDVELLFESRRPAYTAVADLIVDTQGRAPDAVAQEIAAWWSE